MKLLRAARSAESMCLQISCHLYITTCHRSILARPKARRSGLTPDSGTVRSSPFAHDSPHRHHHPSQSSLRPYHQARHPYAFPATCTTVPIARPAHYAQFDSTGLLRRRHLRSQSGPERCDTGPLDTKSLSPILHLFELRLVRSR